MCGGGEGCGQTGRQRQTQVGLLRLAEVWGGGGGGGGWEKESREGKGVGLGRQTGRDRRKQAFCDWQKGVCVGGGGRGGGGGGGLGKRE